MKVESKILTRFFSWYRSWLLSYFSLLRWCFRYFFFPRILLFFLVESVCSFFFS